METKDFPVELREEITEVICEKCDCVAEWIEHHNCCNTQSLICEWHFKEKLSYIERRGKFKAQCYFSKITMRISATFDFSII